MSRKRLINSSLDNESLLLLANEAHSGQPSPLEICNPDIAVKSPCFGQVMIILSLLPVYTDLE